MTSAVSHRFGAQEVLCDVSLDAPAGQFVTLLGASGSGKTTLLRVIAGLIQPNAGRVFVDGEDITRRSPQHRNMGFVFQHYALFPHLTVFDNVAFGLRSRRVRRQEIGPRVREALALVEMESLVDRYPKQLSGGQQQRVALARALAPRPAVLLMDEPLGALDRRLREQVQIELRRLQREVEVTTIYVTHDQEEAMSLADQVVVMDHGRILQSSPPSAIYAAPVCPTVARLVGDLNELSGTIVRNHGAGITIRAEGVGEVRAIGHGRRTGEVVQIGIRPESVQLEPATYCDTTFSAVVASVVDLGSRRVVTLQTGDGQLVKASSNGNVAVREGEVVTAGWSADSVLMFEPDQP